MSVRTNRIIPPLIVVFILATTTLAFAGQIIYVDADGPADFNNIQAAIDDSNDGDEIIVSMGIYYENIDFNGKNIILRSTEPLNPVVVANTMIDGSLGGSVVTFSGTESSACVLSGFTITNGRGTGVGRNYGGGIYGNGTRATIENNIQELSRMYAELPDSNHRDVAGRMKPTQKQIEISRQIKSAQARADRLMRIIEKQRL